jgi:hypothetical protein
MTRTLQNSRDDVHPYIAASMSKPSSKPAVNGATQANALGRPRSQADAETRLLALAKSRGAARNPPSVDRTEAPASSSVLDHVMHETVHMERAGESKQKRPVTAVRVERARLMESIPAKESKAEAVHEVDTLTAQAGPASPTQAEDHESNGASQQDSSVSESSVGQSDMEVDIVPDSDVSHPRNHDAVDEKQPSQQPVQAPSPRKKSAAKRPVDLRKSSTKKNAVFGPLSGRRHRETSNIVRPDLVMRPNLRRLLLRAGIVGHRDGVVALLRTISVALLSEIAGGASQMLQVYGKKKMTSKLFNMVASVKLQSCSRVYSE